MTRKIQKALFTQQIKSETFVVDKILVNQKKLIGYINMTLFYIQALILYLCKVQEKYFQLAAQGLNMKVILMLIENTNAI